MSLLPIMSAANRRNQTGSSNNKPSDDYGWFVWICLGIVVIIGVMILMLVLKSNASREQSQVKQAYVSRLSSYEGKTVRRIEQNFSHFTIEFNDGRSIRVYSHKGLTVSSD